VRVKDETSETVSDANNHTFAAQAILKIKFLSPFAAAICKAVWPLRVLAETETPARKDWDQNMGVAISANMPGYDLCQVRWATICNEYSAGSGVAILCGKMQGVHVVHGCGSFVCICSNEGLQRILLHDREHSRSPPWKVHPIVIPKGTASGPVAGIWLMKVALLLTPSLPRPQCGEQSWSVCHGRPLSGHWTTAVLAFQYHLPCKCDQNITHVGGYGQSVG
jgi:hypothetical protein